MSSFRLRGNPGRVNGHPIKDHLFLPCTCSMPTSKYSYIQDCSGTLSNTRYSGFMISRRGADFQVDIYLGYEHGTVYPSINRRLTQGRECAKTNRVARAWWHTESCRKLESTQVGAVGPAGCHETHQRPRETRGVMPNSPTCHGLC